MSIAILCGKNLAENKSYEWQINSYKQELLALDPSLNIELWPNISDYNKIECALVWRHCEGELLKFPNLKAIFSLGAGVDFILNDPGLPKNIPITRIVDPAMARDITNYAVTAIFNQICRTQHWHQLQKQKKWGKTPPFNFSEKIVGIMGIGFLGSHLARALSHLEIKTVGWSHSPKQITGVHCFAGQDELHHFLRITDILVCLLPYTPRTENIINKETIAQLRPNAYVINIARGGLLVDEDLITALDNGQLSGANLDVFRQEPLNPDHPFWTHPKITVTPHIAAVTNPATVAEQVLDNYHRLMRGKELINLVDITRGY